MSAPHELFTFPIESIFTYDSIPNKAPKRAFLFLFPSNITTNWYTTPFLDLKIFARQQKKKEILYLNGISNIATEQNKNNVCFFSLLVYVFLFIQAILLFTFAYNAIPAYNVYAGPTIME